MKKICLLLLALSTLSYSTPRTSYKTGVAFALGSYFNTPAIKVLEVTKVKQLEENIYAQKIKYQTYNSFGGQLVQEKIFVFKKIDNKFSFVEKLDINEIEI
ncbi:MAG: hypothetical protein ACRC6Z_06500 [Cetobacterium sp.]